MASSDGNSSENPMTTTDEEGEDHHENINNLRNQSTMNTKKISEMQYQFDDARVRIDKLLRRTYPSSRRDSDYTSPYTSYLPTTSYDYDRSYYRSNSINSNDSSRNSTDSFEPKMHKTEVKVKPKKLLREVSISIKCEQDQPIRIIDVS
jgi:hypothetical protein